MKSSKSSYTFKRFEDLKILLDNKSFKNAKIPLNKKRLSSQSKVDKPVKLEPENEHRLFMEAMKGVIPLKNKNRIEPGIACRSPIHSNKTELEIMLHLKKLILEGEGFIVADTPEYQEGAGYKVHPEVLKKLHQGEYAIQDHLDLHGYSVANAKIEFDKFIKKSISYGKNGVLIIHGRGLSSPNQPVLKNNVTTWLTSGKWRKWIIAYTSARNCDGGAGATYVLLRTTPLPKRFRRWPTPESR